MRDRLGLLREAAGKAIPPAELDEAAGLIEGACLEVAAWPPLLARLAEMADRWRAAARQAGAGDESALRADAFALAIAARVAEAKLLYRGKPASLADLAEEGGEAAALANRLLELAAAARRFGDEMDFRFLYNSQRHLFAIGYHVPRESLDQGHYDLLASEACLTSFLAVASGAAPRRHWFQLGRLFIQVAGMPGLMSWSGTMFEYLMPRLFLPAPEGTLLHTAWKAAVARQIEYGKQTGVAWGISESANALTDKAGNYQYQAFGVPGLGLKRGLGRDLVVAPYATMLALGVAPREAVANIRRLAAEGAEGRHGLYEAIDHTPERLPPGQTRHTIRSYMAHHQGMSLLAMANALMGDLMQARLAREPAVRAVDLLLHERIPLDAPVVRSRAEEEASPQAVSPSTEAVSRRLSNPSPREPRPHLLSNGCYTVMLTSGGGGYSTRGDLDVTRWRADAASESWGQFVYVRDLHTLQLWAAAHQPVCKPADSYEAIFSIDKVEYRRRDGDLETHTEVAVSPENDAEVRRVRMINHSGKPREVELTSYAEVVLMPRAADLAHPAFHKLFLQTEWLAGSEALVCRRRPRASDQSPVYAVHVLAADGHRTGAVEYESDRARFLGRRRHADRPAALEPGQMLSGTVGPVLDPVFSIRCRLLVPAGGQATACFTTAFAASREQAVDLANLFHALHAADRVFEVAWAHSRVELKHFNLTIREAQLCQRLAGHVLFPPPSLRAPAEVLSANRQGQAGLWRHGISGDLPIVLVRLPEGRDAIDLFRRALTAHSYWHARGFRTDLVVLNEAPTTYHDEVGNEVMGLIRAGEARDRVDRPGGVFVRKADQFSPDDLTLMLAWARVVLDPRRGSLDDQVGLTVRLPKLPSPLRPAGTPRRAAGPLPVPAELRFFNGVGGFSPDGREYVLAPGAVPPMPWVNVIANPAFGFLVSDSGAGYTWAQNSQLNRLTPWSNDPVSDPPGEIVYLRDERTGEVWTPTPLPAGGPTLVRHGIGYSVFEQRRGHIGQELTVFVPATDAVKVTRLRLSNHGRDARRLSVTYYVEWVLGTQRDLTAMHIATRYDESAGAVIATNPGNAVMAPAVAFAALAPQPSSWTADRGEFLGRNRSLAAPAALERVGLSGRTGAGLDPCAALQVVVEIPPGGAVEVVGLLGTADGGAAAGRLIERHRAPAAAAQALADVKRAWDERLDVVQVRTPDNALNLLLNRWLLYQVVSSRLWGRTGFYQSGGAYGFRDQLQDVMPLVHAAPNLAREQILRAASRQFREGDVQHWWHPPTGHGVRTRFSDDFLWLVLVACHYAEATGDAAVFDERVSFLEAPLLEPHQEEVYAQPQVSAESAPLYDHCLRALEHGWRLGAHGLPLMGIGDWNDGMNKVGAGGKGETVWGAWFQIVCLERFAQAAARRGDEDRAEVCRARAAQLRTAAEEHAWDGQWYRRAYFDDGTPLGSSSNDECRIDSIAQSWAVLAGADPKRSAEAVAEAVSHLVDEAGRLVRLFDPPFDSGPLQPGYIKGYVPGTRENGGQYTHAAVWLIQALAKQGLGDQASDLLELLLPINHADNAANVARYKTEPYVVAADIYGREPHVGRGGWTWYTGSAGWLYQVALGDLLGVRRRGERLVIDPCVPRTWERFEMSYQWRASRYEIVVENPDRVERGVSAVLLDGELITGGEVPLVDDGKQRRVVIRMGAR